MESDFCIATLLKACGLMCVYPIHLGVESFLFSLLKLVSGVKLLGVGGVRVGGRDPEHESRKTL